MLKELMPYFEADDGASGGEAIGNQPDQQKEGTAQPQAKITLKYNGEEKEIDLEEAKSLAQKGLNYDHVQQSWEGSKEKLSKLEVIARKTGFVDKDGHGDLDAYYQAAQEMLETAEKQDMLKGVELPPEIVDELYESRKERQARKEREAQEAKDKSEQEQMSDLLTFFKEMHGREFDIEKDVLPPGVWEATTKGTTPKAAYAEHLARELRKEKEIESVNNLNGLTSPGSVSGKGESFDSDYFTNEQLDKLTDHDLDDPAVYAKAMKSMRRLGQQKG